MDGIDNLDRLSATAQEGTAAVIVQFKIDTDIDYAAIDVQRRVDIARTYMPTDLDPPIVDKSAGDQQAPILTLALSSKTLVGDRTFRRRARSNRPRHPAYPEHSIGRYARRSQARVPCFPDPRAIARDRRDAARHLLYVAEQQRDVARRTHRHGQLRDGWFPCTARSSTPPTCCRSRCPATFVRAEGPARSETSRRSRTVTSTSASFPGSTMRRRSCSISTASSPQMRSSRRL